MKPESLTQPTPVAPPLRCGQHHLGLAFAPIIVASVNQGTHPVVVSNNLRLGVIDPLGQLRDTEDVLMQLRPAQVMEVSIGGISQGPHLQRLVAFPPGDGRGPAQSLLDRRLVTGLLLQGQAVGGKQAACLARTCRHQGQGSREEFRLSTTNSQGSPHSILRHFHCPLNVSFLDVVVRGQTKVGQIFLNQQPLAGGYLARPSPKRRAAISASMAFPAFSELVAEGWPPLASSPRSK